MDARVKPAHDSLQYLPLCLCVSVVIFDMTQAAVRETDVPFRASSAASGSVAFGAIDHLERNGYAVLAGAADTQAAAEAFDSLIAGSSSGSRRVPADAEIVEQLAGQPVVRDIVSRLAGHDARPVRAIAFDKTADANWLVPWHQDRTIAVNSREDAADVINWTVKRGVTHCEPPAAMLETMLTLRWHIDGIGLDDGCLRVLTGTHRLGRLTRDEIAQQLRFGNDASVPVPAGSIFVMRPLLVHSSRRRTTTGRRRVLHVEFAAGDPPVPLQWART
jgi:ectoine hydroxylase-related dioxygenase (phytanoyl-CoA dioxygenase family)